MRIELLGDALGAEPASRVFESVVREMWPPYCGAAIRLALVDVSCLVPVTRFVAKPRLSIADKLLDGIADAGGDPFEPAIIDDGEEWRLVFPPLTEIHDGRAILLDGTHRCFQAIRRNRKSIVVSEVGGVIAELPCRTTTWSSHRIVDKNPSVRDNHFDLDENLFRPGTRYFNGLKYPSRDALMVGVNQYLADT